MLKKMLKKKVAIGSICLFVLLVANMVLGTFWLPIKKAVAADNEIYEDIQDLELDFEGFEDGQADKYLSTYGMPDDYVDKIYDDIERTYGQYVSLRGDFIVFDMEPFERMYGDFLNDAYDMSDLHENEEFEVRTLRMINQNMSVMNELVEEGYGYINENLEFVFDCEDDEYVQLWKVWNFVPRWNKITFNGDSDVAIVASILTLAARTILHVRDILKNIKALAEEGDELLVSIFQECFLVLPSDIASGIVGLFSDPVISILANSFSILLTIAGSSNLFTKAIDIILSIALPSIVDAVVVLYNACKYGRGVEIKGCLIPWKGDKFGASIRSI